MVIFGATGDLTKRLLIPALYNLAVAKLLPDDFACSACRAPTSATTSCASALPKRFDAFAAGKGGNGLDHDACDWLIAAHLTISRAISTTSGPTGGSRTASPTSTASSARAATRSSIWRRRRSLFGTIVNASARPGSTSESERCWRRVVIEKPFGHDLPSARELNRQILGVLRGRARSIRIDHYPRQGDGAEHHGVPLRQRHLRADLEPRPHRPRADHRGRDGRRRAARQASTTRPARCATWCRTTSSSSSRMIAMEPPNSLRRRCRAHREGQGARRRPSLRRRGRRAQRRARPVRRRHGRRAGRSTPTARSRTSRPIPTPRPMSR